jgi:hypothetical protein
MTNPAVAMQVIITISSRHCRMVMGVTITILQIYVAKPLLQNLMK